MEDNKPKWYVGPSLLGIALAVAAITTKVAPLIPRTGRLSEPKIEVFVDGKPVPNLEVTVRKLDDYRKDPNAEPENNICFERGGEFFLYKNEERNIGYRFNISDLLDVGSHPIYGLTSGTITTNPNIEVTLEIPKPPGYEIKKIFIDKENVLDKGVLTATPPEMEGRVRYSMVNSRNSSDIVYWQGKLGLEPGDNFFSPIVRFSDDKWSGVGTDWRYITYFRDVGQAREYSKNPRRAFNSYGGDDPNTSREESEREMTSKLNLIIDKAIADGKL